MALQDYKEKVEERKSKVVKVETNDFPIHTIKGSNLDQEDFPEPFRQHTVVVMERANTVKLPDVEAHWICTDCGAVASSFKTLVKCDKLSSKGHDRVDDVCEKAIADYHDVDRDEYLHDPDFELEEEEKDDDDSIDKSVLNKSGLDAYKK